MGIIRRMGNEVVDIARIIIIGKKTCHVIVFFNDMIDTCHFLTHYRPMYTLPKISI